MFEFIKKMFIGLCTIGSFGPSIVSNTKEPIKWLTLNN